MKVLVLAAGYGTRLKKITKDKPKPLLEVNGKPLLNYILDTLRNLEGLSEIIVVSNDKFYSDFCEWQKSLALSVPISIVNDGTTSPDNRLGSIGDIQFGIDEKKVKEDLLVVGGDNLFDFNLGEFIAFARRQPDSVSIGAYDIEEIKQASKFGVLSLDAEGVITSFEEKPEHPKSSLVAMCFYYLPQNTLGLISKYLKETNKADRAGDYIKWLCQHGNVYGFTFTGKWFDIGSVESYKEANKKFC